MKIREKKIERIEMDNNVNKSRGNFFSGFLLGIFIGAAVALLLVTKKGKKILKAISEEGEGKITDILDKLDKSVSLPEEALEDEGSSFVKASANKESDNEEESLVKRDKPKVKRFFKGVSRRLN